MISSDVPPNEKLNGVNTLTTVGSVATAARKSPPARQSLLMILDRYSTVATPGLIPGIMTSVITALVLISCVLIYRHQSDPARTCRICSKKAWSFMIMLAFAFISILFYALPVIFFVINIIKAVL